MPVAAVVAVLEPILQLRCLDGGQDCQRQVGYCWGLLLFRLLLNRLHCYSCHNCRVLTPTEIQEHQLLQITTPFGPMKTGDWWVITAVTDFTSECNHDKDKLDNLTDIVFVTVSVSHTNNMVSRPLLGCSAHLGHSTLT